MASDYDIVLANANMKLKVRYYPKIIRIRFDLDKHKEPEIESVVPDSDWWKVRSPQSDWPRNIHYRQKHQRMATGNSWRGTGEETEKVKIWIMNEIFELCDERRDQKELRRPSDEARSSTDIAQRHQKENEINH